MKIIHSADVWYLYIWCSCSPTCQPIWFKDILLYFELLKMSTLKLSYFLCVNSSTLCSFWHVLFNFSNSEWHLLLPIIELWLEGVNCVEQLEKFFYLILFQVIPKPEQRGKILFGLDHGQLNTGPFGGCIFRHNITKKGHIWDFGCMFSNDESDMGSGYVNR